MNEEPRAGQAAVPWAGRLLKSTAALAAARWGAWKLGNAAADEGLNQIVGKAREAADHSRYEELAQGLSRQRGWQYTRLVVDDDWRYVVWDGDRPMAAFPAVLNANTPEALAERFELAGYTPPADELLSPPPG
jgi:hypothetical protein